MTDSRWATVFGRSRPGSVTVSVPDEGSFRDLDSADDDQAGRELIGVRRQRAPPAR